MMTKPSDATLIRSYQLGKDMAFEKLFKRYERPLFSFLLRLTRNQENAEDIFQQTWMKAINGLSGYQERGTFSGWLFGIAYHCFIDLTRKESRSKVHEKISADSLDKMPDMNMNPEMKLLNEEKISWMEEAIQQLPDEQKQVVLMRITGELPFKEIAEILDCPINTVLGRMHYAVKNLQKMKKEAFRENYQYAV